MIRLFISDLDHTLLIHDAQGNYMRPEDLAAIAALRERGVDFLVASGRDHGFLKNCLDQHGLYCDMIATNGSTAWLDGQPVIAHFADVTAVKALFTYVQTNYPHVHMKASAAGDHEYTCNTLAHKHAGYPQGDTLSAYMAQADIRINRLAVALDTQEELLAAKADIEERFGDWLEFNQSSVNLMDITPKGINKGTAVREIMARRGYLPAEVAAIGDSPNDIDMFAVCGLSFAMASGNKKTLRQADYIVAGVAEAIAHLLKP